MITQGKWEVDPIIKKDVVIRRDLDNFIIMRIPCKREANATLIAAAPETAKQRDEMLEAANNFVEGWLHFCKCIDFGKSNLDAKAIRFMNEVPGELQRVATRPN